MQIGNSRSLPRSDKNLGMSLLHVTQEGMYN